MNDLSIQPTQFEGRKQFDAANNTNNLVNTIGPQTQKTSFVLRDKSAEQNASYSVKPSENQSEKPVFTHLNANKIRCDNFYVNPLRIKENEELSKDFKNNMSAALRGDPIALEATKNLANIYYNELETGEALETYQILAGQGNAQAQYLLAIHLEFGYGIQKNTEEALKYYQLAADQKDPEAMFTLAFHHAEGDLVPQDYTQAAKLIREYIALGYGQKMTSKELEERIFELGDIIFPEEFANALEELFKTVIVTAEESLQEMI